VEPNPGPAGQKCSLTIPFPDTPKVRCPSLESSHINTQAQDALVVPVMAKRLRFRGRQVGFGKQTPAVPIAAAENGQETVAPADTTAFSYSAGEAMAPEVPRVAMCPTFMGPTGCPGDCRKQ